MENVQEQNNVSLRELNTPFGKMYIEPWEWHKNNKYPYHCSDRITLYDSHKDYFDYFTISYFEDGEETPEEEYEKLCRFIESGCETICFKEFVDWFCIDYDYAGPDKEAAANALSDGFPQLLLPDEVETNEYVNHIGDNYIVVSDR